MASTFIKFKSNGAVKAMPRIDNNGACLRIDQIGITDLNDLRTCGRYGTPSNGGYGIANTPTSSGWYFIDVWAYNEKECLQEARLFGNTEVYSRWCNSEGVWSDWQKLH